MTIDTAFRSAALEWLRDDKQLSRLVNSLSDGQPVRAAMPYLVCLDSLVGDWSTKDRLGRETRLALLIEGRGENPARIGAIAAQIDKRLAALPRAAPGFAIASLIFLRGRLARESDGRWSQLIEYRVRLIEQ